MLQAESESDLAAVRCLFEAYTESLGIDLAYQDYGTELATLPGKYATPTGALLLARGSHGESLGCAALRPLGGELAEIKRLYVSPAGRGQGLGKSLVEAIIERARALGYKALRLDTLPSMQAAISLYESLGFRRIDAYYSTPIAGTVFMEKTL